MQLLNAKGWISLFMEISFILNELNYRENIITPLC